jgi:hypothetical protein
MKTFLVALSCATLALSAAPLLGAETAAPAANHYTTRETTMGKLLSDPAAKEVLDQHLPGLSASPQISMASGMTLSQIAQMAPDRFPADLLARIDADLAKIPAK